MPSELSMPTHAADAAAPIPVQAPTSDRVATPRSSEALAQTADRLVARDGAPSPARAVQPLVVLAGAFCALPGLAWAVSGHWVPEVMVFGVAAGLVALVRRMG